ncbi:MAG: HesA/MoeB/ThiF family protein [Flavobacteriaceae bacterium]|nr:HesA/MoeB/ThiF family protein [Flavobacteriaceae bacterium]
MNRYIRQIQLKNIGVEGQKKLKTSKVLVVGVGGLGSAVIPYLVSSGIGVVGIIDGDKVQLSNLPRQVIFSESDIGFSKVDMAYNSLKNNNKECKIIKFNEFLDKRNSLKIFKKFDIIVDATDSIEMRYLINDTCLKTNIPFVYGAIYRFQGQVSTFNYKNGPTYRCLYSNQSRLVENCEEAGVTGSTVGLIGMLQLNEVMKIILNIGDVLSGRVLIYNTLNSKQEIIRFKKLNYKALSDIRIKEDLISFEEAKKQDDVIILDVRENYELPIISSNKIINIPLSQISNKVNLLKKNKNLVLFCQSGKRSKIALDLLKKNNFLNIKLMKDTASEIFRKLNT